MKRYDSYKDSGVEWIGKIPEHWLIKRIKHTTYVKGRIGWQGLRSEEFLEVGESYVVTGTDFKNGKINWSSCYQITKQRYDEDPYIQLKEDDLLITKDGTIGKIALVKDIPTIATLNSGVFVTRPNTTDYITEFMYWILVSDVFDSFFNNNKSGSTILHLYQNVFNEFRFICPPLKEQTQIAKYLDKKNTQIDKLIADKQKLIELLNEERTAMINQAVTKGLNLNVPMKYSGIEWIGEIPEHWEVKKLKHIAKITRGAILRPVDEPAYFDEKGEWTYLNISDATASGKYLYNGKLRLSELGSQKSARVEPNNLIITASATIGKPFINKIPVCIHDGFIPFTDLRVDINYLYSYFINPTLFDGIGKSNTQKNIYVSEVKDMDIAVPPREEQERIAVFIEKKTVENITILEKTEAEIELLKEYKTALISEVVTGKVDVRDEVIDNCHAEPVEAV